MSIGVYANVSGSTIFDINRLAPQAAVASAVEQIEEQLSVYEESTSETRAAVLLDEIERLRRFVLVRASLARGLAKTHADDRRSIGGKLCDALHAMIGDVPHFVSTYTAPGAPMMERDTFRVIACLNFLGSLDPSFL